MKKDLILISVSVLSVALMTIHLASDIVLGLESGGPLNLIVFPVLTVWLYGTLMLAGKRSGYIITLLGAFLGLLMPIIHMKGNGISARVIESSTGFLFVWTLLALGVTSFFAATLSVIELWKLRTKS